MDRWVDVCMDGWTDEICQKEIGIEETYSCFMNKGRGKQQPVASLWMGIECMESKTGKEEAGGVGWSQTANQLFAKLRSLDFSSCGHLTIGGGYQEDKHYNYICFFIKITLAGVGGTGLKIRRLFTGKLVARKLQLFEIGI